MSNFGDLHTVMANPRDTLAKFVPRKAASLDTIRINMYLGKIMEWAVTRFTWNNLPDTVDARYIESTLNTAGMCIFYYDARYGKHLCVAANPIGDYDVYGNSYKYQTESYGKYYGLTIDAEDCVPIWHNLAHMHDQLIYLDYATRLSDIEQTLDITAKNMRNPRIVSCPPGQRQTYDNVLRDIERGAPVIYGGEALLQNDEIKVLDLTVNPAYLEHLRDERDSIWRDCLTFLGINSTNETKAERMISDEAGARDGQLAIARASMWKSRDMACKQINDKFGMDISVEWSFEEEVLPDIEEVNNGEIYDGAPGRAEVREDSGGEDRA